MSRRNINPTGNQLLAAIRDGCGELATPLLTVKPVGVYSTTFVQYLYISCYLTINQCCRTSRLSCFHSGDPDQVVPFALYTVLLYTHTHTHTSAVPSASRSLSRLRKWFLFQVSQCTLHWLQLSQHISLAIPIKKQQFFLQIQLSVGSKQRATTTLDFEHVFSLLSVFSLFVRTV